MALDRAVIGDLCRDLAGADDNAGRLNRIAVVLDLAGEGGKYCADVAALALQKRRRGSWR